MRGRVHSAMKSATEQLIDLVERLRPTGEIGDGMVAELHDLAARARVERARKSTYPPCYGSEPDEQAFAENDCGSCVVAHPCLDI